jgi:hypothetical protein
MFIACTVTTKAQELARDAGLKDSQFKALHSWALSFLKLHRMAFRARSRCGNAWDADGQAAAIKFGQDVADIIILQRCIPRFNGCIQSSCLKHFFFGC